MFRSCQCIIALAIGACCCDALGQDRTAPPGRVTLERPISVGQSQIPITNSTQHRPEQSNKDTARTPVASSLLTPTVTLGTPVLAVATIQRTDLQGANAQGANALGANMLQGSAPQAGQPIVSLGLPILPLPESSDRNAEQLSLPAPESGPSADSRALIWQDQLMVPQISAANATAISLTTIVPAALQQSRRIQIAKLQSFEEFEKITQADANFDWTLFTRKIWTDTDEPTGSQLDAGPGTVRRLEEDLSVDVGSRRTNRLGGQFEASQNLNLNNTNSTFFDPRDRGIARLTLRYTQPLLRDGGRLVNEGQVVLAQLQSEATDAAYQAEINDVLQRVVQAYWELFRSRADYCIRKALVADTQELLLELDRRRRIDAQPALIAQVESQLKGQLADLDAALVRIQQAQYELVRQVGDRGLDAPLELIPQEIPSAEPLQLDLVSVFTTAMQNRGELRTSLKRIQSSQLNKDIAQNQLLPRLAMILETSATGINGNFNAIRSLGDQFSERAPTYSIGFTYEYPLGNRAAQSRARQAGFSLAREMMTFEDTVDQIRKEVRDSVAALEGFVSQAKKRQEAVELADREVTALLERRLKFPAEFDQVSQLYLRTYLDALQRRAQAEQALVSAHVDYSLSLVQLRRALGILANVDPVQL